MARYILELPKGKLFISTPALRDACKKLRPLDELLVPYYHTNASRLGNIRGEFPHNLACLHPKGSAYSVIFITPDATQVELAAKGEHFVYFSIKTREPYPLDLFEDGGEDALYILLNNNKVKKDYDYPLIPYGFYHNNLFKNGLLVTEELERLRKIWKEIND